MRIAMFQGPERATDVAANLLALARAAEECAARGAHLLVCPEMSATGYNIGSAVQQRAETRDGSMFEHVAEIAQRTQLLISYGYPERAGPHIYNATQVVDGGGHRLAHYRKSHLYGDLDRSAFEPGDDLVVQFEVCGLICGLLTCYDVEFPEPVRAHALAGTEVLIVPTGLMMPYDFVSRTLVPARAYESQMYVAYINRSGVEGELEYCGLSCVVAPDGAELVRAGRTEELLFADVDRAGLARARSVNSYLEDRRPAWSTCVADRGQTGI